MPNWCNNVVKMTAISKDMIDRAVKSAESGLLQEFIPCPQELLDIVSGSVGVDGSPEQIALEDQYAANIKKYGYPTWYEWKIANWGTKWDLCDCTAEISDDGYEVTLKFDTAWSPPLEAYNKLIDLGFSIKAYYYEPGMEYAGIWENGQDDYYKDWSDAVSAEAILPKELNDMFSVSKSHAEWEDIDEDNTDFSTPALPAP